MCSIDGQGSQPGKGSHVVTAIRNAVISDARDCGRVIYMAFKSLADHHRFTDNLPSVEVATGVATMMLTHPAFHGVVAEEDGRVLGCNFIDLRPPVAGIGPIAVDPATQNRGVGRSLMHAVLDSAKAQGMGGIRLVQAAYNNRSLCLYTRLGFQTRAPLSVMQGPPLHIHFPGYNVRAATRADIDACNQLCRKVHGFNRGGELSDAISANTAVVVEHLGGITGYATAIGFFAHASPKAIKTLRR
jgi:GNAT superfamily N-acetyltransferase